MPGLCISCKNAKHVLANMFSSLSGIAWYMVVIITRIDLSQKVLATEVSRALKSLKHRRKHIRRSLQLDGDQV